MKPPSIVWFQRDLRLADHPALTAACRAGNPVIPVFIWPFAARSAKTPGAASRWWLHHSLQALRRDLQRQGSDLVLRISDDLPAALLTLVRESGATSVFWNRTPEPSAQRKEEQAARALARAGRSVHRLESALFFPPGDLLNQQGRPFQVFTPFWRRLLEQWTSEEPLPAPRQIPSPSRFPSSARWEDAGLLPAVNWADGLAETWEPGERGARLQWRRFLNHGLEDYPTGRDRPDREGTSRLSPHLHFGEITVRQLYRDLERRQGDPRTREAVQGFFRQLGWREFAHHLLFHFPKTPGQPLRAEFSAFPWWRHRQALRRWQKGQTGYPIVDAGMRELWHTGWMHNRVRMIAGSFLVKDLLQPWQDGAAWFRDTLVDADLANNTLGWQWVAGCGADAAPYFRIFNPVLQGEKFDPQGNYVRRWIPELETLDARWIHQPWAAPAEVRRNAALERYPAPIVEHGAARDRALAAYSAMRDRLRG